MSKHLGLDFLWPALTTLPREHRVVRPALVRRSRRDVQPFQGGKVRSALVMAWYKCPLRSTKERPF